MRFTVALSCKDGWKLRNFQADSEVEAAYMFHSDSVVYDSTGKAIHLVRRWQPKTLKTAITKGAKWEMDPYAKAITGIDQRACDKLIAGLRRTQGGTQ